MRPSRSNVVIFVLSAMLSALTGAGEAQVFTSIHSFTGADGALPEYEALAQGTDGNLYGTTAHDGAFGNGTVFKITPGGTLGALSFANGSNAKAGLILATNGKFYGTTFANANFDGGGTIFELGTGGALTTLDSFVLGYGPAAPLVEGTDGNFYGTTAYGGTNGYGTVFRVSAGGLLTTLHSFDSTDGATPWAGLVEGTDGNFYGTTATGGNLACSANPTYGCGTVFKITPGGRLTTVHVFDGTDGYAIYSGLIQGTDGNFYGTAGGYTNGPGTVFTITPTGVLTTLHYFQGGNDGKSPFAGVTQATDGNFYGSTFEGGAGWGTIFMMTPSGAVTTLHVFNITDGYGPWSLTQATNGTFYGTTDDGGANVCSGVGAFGCGTVFSVSMELGPFVSFVRSSGKVGQTAKILGQGLTGTTGVSFNGVPATTFKVVKDTYLTAVVPNGATTGKVVVTTPGGALTSNVSFRVVN
jgi:uncharacterized repeat protein (TIGR03803 family)